MCDPTHAYVPDSVMICSRSGDFPLVNDLCKSNREDDACCVCSVFLFPSLFPPFEVSFYFKEYIVVLVMCFHEGGPEECATLCSHSSCFDRDYC